MEPSYWCTDMAGHHMTHRLQYAASLHRGGRLCYLHSKLANTRHNLRSQLISNIARSLRGCKGRAFLPMILSAYLKSPVEISNSSFRMYHVTSSVHGGVVREPLRRKYRFEYLLSTFAICQRGQEGTRVVMSVPVAVNSSSTLSQACITASLNTLHADSITPSNH